MPATCPLPLTEDPEGPGPTLDISTCKLGFVADQLQTSLYRRWSRDGWCFVTVFSGRDGVESVLFLPYVGGCSGLISHENPEIPSCFEASEDLESVGCVPQDGGK